MKIIVLYAIANRIEIRIELPCLALSNISRESQHRKIEIVFIITRRLEKEIRAVGQSRADRMVLPQVRTTRICYVREYINLLLYIRFLFFISIAVIYRLDNLAR